VRKLSPYLLLLLLLAACLSLATILQPRTPRWSKRAQSDNILTVLFGDGRRLFANHFFVQADVSYHSGYYPSIFDQARAPKDTRHLTAKEGEPAAEEHERQMSFLGPPRDWIERFGRHFIITEHTHLQGNNEREILPWLKISAELDPQKVETYTVSAFWLRDLGKVKEAEDFLREGLRNNPDSYEILFELGRLYYENYHDAARARNVWELGLHKWSEQEAAGKKPDLLQLDQLAVGLARLEEKEGNLARAIQLLGLAQKGSPHPEVLQSQIDDLKQKLGTRPPAASPGPR
jgi:tetratricopeptide (TPR) repeat protein